jgi:hypothetical protein
VPETNVIYPPNGRLRYTNGIGGWESTRIQKSAPYFNHHTRERKLLSCAGWRTDAMNQMDGTIVHCSFIARNVGVGTLKSSIIAGRDPDRFTGDHCGAATLTLARPARFARPTFQALHRFKTY